MYGIIVMLHTFVMGFWKHWYGGYSFGYRMAGDVIPFLVLMLVPFITSTFYSKKVLKNIFIIFVVISVLVQFYGMVFFDSIWHNAYDTGFRNTSWLWSVNNSEAAFNIRRVMVKLKLLDKESAKSVYRVFEDDEWLVIRPLTIDASARYGASTKWCTTMIGKDYFHRYSDRGCLLYNINKKTGSNETRTKSSSIEFN